MTDNPEYLLFLGAGASYGSETDKSIVPPLASDLFDELLKFDANVWGHVSGDIAKVYRSDFEAGMLALADKMPHALTIIQRSMAGFFYRFGPTSSSLYVKLAKRMKSCNWKGAIATLNYERMVLLALNREGCTPVCGLADAKQIEICVPHGCCNLFCDSVHGVASAVSMTGMNVSTNGPISCVDHPDAFWPRIRNDAFPPVMSYFEPNKFTTSGANFIETQRHRLTYLMANAKSIAVVGVRVREQDSHIWGALALTNASIYYCSGKRGADAYKEWQVRARGAKGAEDVISSGYWDTDFDAINAHLGLEP